MTHCSACGRRLRFKRAGYGSGAAPDDWLNHSRGCARYGLPPDAERKDGR